VGVILRDARPGDAEPIARLHTDSWRRTYRGMMSDEFLDGGALANRQNVWHERLNSGPANQFVCVAEHDGEVGGFICAFADADPSWGSYIDNLHVAYRQQRRGVGRALMGSAGDWLCRVQPDRAVFLWVMEANLAAREFYERLGARNAGTVSLEDPSGGFAPNCRYVWASPHRLTQGGLPR
jgi:ribosomal protein S18 acetylase RimI-like enzyme